MRDAMFQLASLDVLCLCLSILKNGMCEQFSLVGHSNRVSNVVFSPTGNLLASGQDGTNDILLWDVKRRKLLRTLAGPAEGELYSIAFAPGAEQLAGGFGEAGFKIWDLRTKKGKDGTLYKMPDVVRHVAYSPDGKMLATAV